MIIRPAKIDDAAGVAGIVNQVIRDTTNSFKPKELSHSEVQSQIAIAPAYFVAVDQRSIIGFATYDQFRKGPGYARTMEHTIMLAPNARGTGAGRALMKVVEDHARNAGVGSLWAGISSENPEGISFHLALGFEEVAQLPKVGYKFDRWLDLVLMR
ncbi:MAG: GNAT family N-acetyltransferase, partial [Boseongicola sp.]